MPEFEFDVAFSLHSSDLAKAHQLNERLRDRFRTFIFTEHQDELAGRNGEEVFNRVFGEQSRIVVVFYNSQWGTTPFTRHEETAIRNRAHEDGYGFTLFIPTDKPPQVPKWLPKQHLYFNWDEYGIEGAAAVVEKLIDEAGGTKRVETATERAARLGRANAFNAQRDRYLGSIEGLKASRDSFATLVSEIEKVVELINKAGHIDLAWRQFSFVWALLGGGPCLTIVEEQRHGSGESGAHVRVELYNAPPHLPGTIPMKSASRLWSRRYRFDLVAPETTAYVLAGQRPTQTTPEQLADSLVREFLNQVDAQSNPRR